jgi:hypothetical protein
MAYLYEACDQISDFCHQYLLRKNETKNVHICSMCIKTNKVGKQEIGIWRVPKRYPQYGIPIWRWWPNIRFLPSTLTEKNATKNILDGRNVRFLFPVCRLCWFLYTLNIYAHFSSHFFSANIDGRNLIFGHKLHIGTPYRRNHFWTHQIPTSCLPILLIFIYI